MRKGWCRNGHEITGENEIKRGRGSLCRRCNLAYRRRRYADLKASGLTRTEAAARC